MKSKQETFDTLLSGYSNRHDLQTVFEDFLTMTICAFSQNPITRKSYNEDQYLETAGRYKQVEVRSFAEVLSTLVLEMDTRIGSDAGNDVLGEFYETHLAKRGKSQHFTPWHVCRLMAETLGSGPDNDAPIRILDPTCGSGRMLIAGATRFGPLHEYYGVDIDLTCVKMAVLNLFLNGVLYAEVLCADALLPGDFRVSYITSYLPFGIFRIDKKEDSRLRHLMQAETADQSSSPAGDDSILILKESDGPHASDDASQLRLF